MKKIRFVCLTAFCVALFSFNTIAQTTIFSENVGTTTGTESYASNAWQNSAPISFTGTGDTRSTTVSTGYTGASGSRNVFLTNNGTASLTIEGINTSNYGTLVLSFGFFKSTTLSDGTELSVEVSEDGKVYTPLIVPPRPTGGGTANWILTSTTGTIPSASNLRIRFTNTSIAPQFRLDDITLTGFTTSAASGTVAGRVRDFKGNGLKFVTVMITGGGLDEPLYATTNQFGKYLFEDIPVGENYVLQVFSRRHTFEEQSRIISLKDFIEDADFIGRERF